MAFNQSDGYKNTGCYNLECPGFVQTNSQFALGSILTPVSSYNGPQVNIVITIHKVYFKINISKYVHIYIYIYTHTHTHTSKFLISCYDSYVLYKKVTQLLNLEKLYRTMRVDIGGWNCKIKQ